MCGLGSDSELNWVFVGLFFFLTVCFTLKMCSVIFGCKLTAANFKGFKLMQSLVFFPSLDGCFLTHRCLFGTWEQKTRGALPGNKRFKGRHLAVVCWISCLSSSFFLSAFILAFWLAFGCLFASFVCPAHWRAIWSLISALSGGGQMDDHTAKSGCASTGAQKDTQTGCSSALDVLKRNEAARFLNQAQNFCVCVLICFFALALSCERVAF